MATSAAGECLVSQVGCRMGARLLAAHLFGALFMFGYLEFVAPAERAMRARGMGADVVTFVVFAGLTFPLAGWWVFRAYCAPLDWLKEDREPTDVERRRTLQLPFRLAAGPMVCWVLGALLFGVGGLRYGHTGAYVCTVVINTVTGGIVSCTVAYLLIERTFRPIFALVLSGEAAERPATLGVRPRLLLAWVLGSAVPLIALLALPEAARHADERQAIGGAVVALAIDGLLVGGLAMIVTARSLAEPLDGLRDGLGRVQRGDLSASVPVDDGGEIGLLQAGFNRMVGGLRERQQLQDLFGRHVGAEVARHALSEAAGLGGEVRDASVLVVDVVGSTAMAEVLPPSVVVDTLNAFFGAVVDAVGAEGGWVNKFQGDGALCVFGAPATQPDHAARALRAARRLDERLRVLGDVHPGLTAGIGVSSGPVVAGNVGTEARYEYTVLGGPVNEAARLSDVAKGRAGRVLASAESLARAGAEGGPWVDRGAIALRGRSAPTAVAEPAAAAALA